MFPKEVWFVSEEPLAEEPLAEEPLRKTRNKKILFFCFKNGLFPKKKKQKTTNNFLFVCFRQKKWCCSFLSGSSEEERQPFCLFQKKKPLVSRIQRNGAVLSGSPLSGSSASGSSETNHSACFKRRTALLLLLCFEEFKEKKMVRF